jgi:sirohydrochlorin ferrochelatase
MNTLILVAHGSRVHDAQREVESLASQLERMCVEQFRYVSAAFLEIASPSMSDQIKNHVGLGAKHITLLPYFLSVGKHVRSDLPDIVEQSQKKYPNVVFNLKEHIGASTLMLDLAKKCALD